MAQLNPEGKIFKQEALELIMAHSSPIFQCKDCSHPVLDGYCCDFCHSSSPVSQDQEPISINV